MQRFVLWVTSLFILLALPSRSQAEYVEVLNACLKQFNDRIWNECGDGMASIHDTRECVEALKAQSPNSRRDCEQMASFAAGYLTESTDEQISTGCTPAPGFSCPAVATSPRPRSRPTSLGQRAPPAAGAIPQEGGSPQATDQAQSQAQSDIAACGQASTTAVNCCGSPLSCMSASERASLTNAPTATGGGLTEACRQMAGLGGSSSALNTRVAAICSGGQRSCQTSCAAMIAKYQSLASNCNGCASQNIYDSTLQQLSASRNACSSLQAQVNAYAAQATESSSSQAYAANCLQSAGLGGSAQSIPSSINNEYLYDCATNPTSLACQGQKPAALAQTDGTSAFREAKGDAQPTFNLDPTTGMEGSTLPSGQSNAKPNSANVVANNAGGSIPGQGGGASAKLDPARPSRAGGGPSTTSTDIMQGERSGGYTSAANGSGFDDSGTYLPGRGQPKGLADGSQSVGMDLKQYLPGAEHDPTRRLAGVTGGGQINGKSEDIFHIISIKMTEKCRLGVLWRCQ